MKIPFSPPYIWENEIKAITEVLRSGWITTWPKNKEFEEKISNFIWCEKVNLVSSATAWLETVLRILWIWAWDEVIIPAYTYTATASSILHVWAKPIIVDIDKKNFNISLEEIEKNITENTKAIIPVDFWGYPVDYNWLNNLVKKYKRQNWNKIFDSLWRIAIISDAAHSFWWEYKWIKIWAKWLNDFTVYSFHAVKNLTTAEWWAITYNFWEEFNDYIYKQIKLWTLHWQTKDAFTKTNWNWEYDIIFSWYKANMTDIQAAIWIKQLEKYDDILKQRENIYNKYNDWLKKLEEKWILELPKWINWNTKWSFHLYPILLNKNLKNKRNEIIEKLQEKWISTNVHFKPLPLLTAYNNLWYKADNIPNSIDKFEREISLPIWPWMNEEEVEYVVNNFIKLIK
jgi:dTDP-4-amino-4,6-dideoxygalactose transaminase